MSGSLGEDEALDVALAKCGNVIVALTTANARIDEASNAISALRARLRSQREEIVRLRDSVSIGAQMYGSWDAAGRAYNAGETILGWLAALDAILKEGA
jgi:hypothetical protein